MFCSEASTPRTETRYPAKTISLPPRLRRLLARMQSWPPRVSGGWRPSTYRELGWTMRLSDLYSAVYLSTSPISHAYTDGSNGDVDSMNVQQTAGLNYA